MRVTIFYPSAYFTLSFQEDTQINVEYFISDVKRYIVFSNEQYA